MRPADSWRSQRLTYHRHGEVTQRDTPKSNTATETVATFQYWSMPGKTAKGPPGVPLEIEWKAERGQLEASADHKLTLGRARGGLQVGYVAEFKIKSLFPGVETIDVQLPRSQTPWSTLAARVRAPALTFVALRMMTPVSGMAPNRPHSTLPAPWAASSRS